ncbi:MAG: hypothetical protein GC159_18785 [Phycisphaera sp.]|nr:hypothetical protein [Phycisphaera sp.]
MHPPDLATFDRPPSWVNNNHRPDRSACLDVRAAHVWRSVNPAAWSPVPAKPQPGTRRPDARVSPEARAQLTLHARDLQHIFDHARPFPLVGDLRTPKSNALKDPTIHPVRRRHRKPTDAPYRARRSTHDKQRYADPNRGAAAVKTLALPALWSQRLTLERWRLHDRLAQHFLLCPRCGEKKSKLFLLLATDDERRDADLALDYLHRLNRYRPNRPGSPDELRLVQRFGPLFPPRPLLCLACLDLRYGYARFPVVLDPIDTTRLSRTAAQHTRAALTELTNLAAAIHRKTDIQQAARKRYERLLRKYDVE